MAGWLPELTFEDIAIRRKFLPFTKDKDGKKVPLYGWAHPNYPDGFRHQKRVDGKTWKVSSTTPAYHLTLPEIMAMKAEAQKVIWPAVVIGDIGFSAAPRTKGEAEKGDAPFLRDNLYFEFDGDIEQDDGTPDWQKANDWMERMKAILAEVFPIHYISVGGRGWHFPVRLHPDCQYFLNPAKFNIACPYGYAHIEAWSPIAGARNMIWGDKWFNQGEPCKLPLSEPVPILTDEAIDFIKGYIPGNWEGTRPVFLPPGMEYSPTREGAVARVLLQDSVVNAVQPHTKPRKVRYIQLQDGTLALIKSEDGQTRFLELMKEQDDRIFGSLVDNGLDIKQQENWFKQARDTQKMERVPILIKSIDAYVANYATLPDEVRPRINPIPDVPYEELNRITRTREGVYDPVLVFIDGVYRLSTLERLEPEEVAARRITLDVPLVPVHFPKEPGTGYYGNIGKELYRVWAEANGREFLILLLTQRVSGMGLCIGETERGKTTLMNLFQAAGLGAVIPPYGFPEIFTKSFKRRPDQFSRRDMALATKRCLVVEEIATDFTERNFTDVGSFPPRIDEQGFKEMTGKPSVEYRNLYEPAVVAPVIASILAVSNTAPIISALEDKAIERRIWGFKPAIPSELLAPHQGILDEDFTHPETIQAFLYEWLQDCAALIPGWDGKAPEIKELPAIVEATAYVRKAIEEQNEKFDLFRETVYKKKGKTDGNLEMSENVRRIVGDV